jgi:hypothetical protein
MSHHLNSQVCDVSQSVSHSVGFVFMGAKEIIEISERIFFLFIWHEVDIC